MKKRIAIDARESGTTTGRYVDKLIEYLHKIDTDYEFVLMTKPHRVDYLRSIAPNFLIKVADFKEFTFSEQIGFLRFCRNIKADLIHFPMVQQPVLYRQAKVTTMNDLTTLRFSNPSKNPFIFRFKQHIYAWVNKKVARNSDHLLTYTRYVKDDIVDFTGVTPGKITVTPLAADLITEKAAPIPDLQGKSFIMYVGRPQSHKNLRRLIDVFAKLQDEQPNLQLVLVGKRDELYAQHLEYAKRQGIENVVMTGFVSEGELRWLYNNCRAYIFPSLSEGFGLPGLEAMAHNAPVVSSNATCLPEVNGSAAYYFDPRDEQDMFKKILDVLTDEELRSRLIKKGTVQAKKYSWGRLAAQTLDVYKDTLKDT